MESNVNARKLGASISRLREAEGISQEELAERCGLHRTYIGSVERGERNVSLNNIVRIAKALRTKASVMVEGL